MAKTIQGVPENITRDQFLGIFTAVGINAEDCTKVELLPDGVHATVFERHADGTKVVNLDGNGFAKHNIHIPVTD